MSVRLDVQIAERFAIERALERNCHLWARTPCDEQIRCVICKAAAKDTAQLDGPCGKRPTTQYELLLGATREWVGCIEIRTEEEYRAYFRCDPPADFRESPPMYVRKVPT